MAYQSLYMPKAKKGDAYWGAGTLELERHLSDVANIDVTQNAFFLGKAGDVTRGYFYLPNMSGADGYALDLKIDDGKPYSGKILVSTYDDNFGYYWESSVNASSLACTYGGADEFDAANQYNSNPTTGGNKLTCKPIFVW